MWRRVGILLAAGVRKAQYVPDNRRAPHWESEEARMRMGDSVAAELLRQQVDASGTKRVKILAQVVALARRGFHVREKTGLMALHLAAVRKDLKEFSAVQHYMAQHFIPYRLTEAFNALMELCLALAEPHILPAIRAAMDSQNVPLDRVTYILLLKGLWLSIQVAHGVGDAQAAAAAAHPAAVGILREAEGRGYPVDKQLGTLLLQCAPPDAGRGYVATFRERGVDRDIMLWTAHLRAVSTASEDPTLMWEAFQAMHRDGVAPDAVCWLQYLNMCGRTYNLDGLSAGVNVMLAAKVRLTAHCYTTILNALPPHIACGNAPAYRLAELIYRELDRTRQLNDMRKQRMATCLAALGARHAPLLRDFADAHPSHGVANELSGYGLGALFAAAAAKAGAACSLDAVTPSLTFRRKPSNARATAMPVFDRRGGAPRHPVS
eukprot:TRINITY_DN24622_c0_g1_i1.p1 TRINITY_DN24622_c0_g1~~TRINITY_DN24622_c0_g1_i1.p1  ORF type:complete len:435 (+),score=100.89 TRINITY_DN24622_c0_g1_i1:74-1378(+)